MKHASAVALSSLERVLAALRQMPGLVERKPGIFYVKGKAYLHFHEDPAGLFADVKLDGVAFERFPINTQQAQADLLAVVAENLGA